MKHLLLLTALLLAGCSTAQSGTDDADSHYLVDLRSRHVPGADIGLGHAVCSDIVKGSDAAGEFMAIVKQGFTIPQAEIITYWAITDMCPQYASQLREAWREGM